MNQALSLRPTQAGRALVLLAALGFTALTGLAALEPAIESGRSALPADIPQSRELDPALRTVEPGVLPADINAQSVEDATTPRFERSNEPAIEVDAANAHGG
jgi:hypothetical protein